MDSLSSYLGESIISLRVKFLMKGFFGSFLLIFGLGGLIEYSPKHDFDWLTFLFIVLFFIGLNYVIDDKIDERIGKP